MSHQYPSRITATDGCVATWNIADMSDPFLVVSSVPADTDDAKLALLSIVQADSVAGTTLHGQHIYLGEYVVHPVVLQTRATGRTMVGRRIIFPQPDGRLVDFISEKAIKSLAVLAAESGRSPPWDPPLKVLIKRRLSKSGKYEWSFVIAR